MSGKVTVCDLDESGKVCINNLKCNGCFLSVELYISQGCLTILFLRLSIHPPSKIG